MNTLLNAIITGDTDTLAQELNNGASADTMDVTGLTALHYAVLYGHQDQVALLLENGATLIRTSFEGQQAIHFAAMVHDGELISFLADQGATVNAVDYSGSTPLHYAVANQGSGELVQQILDLGANIDTVNNLGETALHIAAKEGNIDVTAVLLENGASDSIANEEGNTASEEAARTGHESLLSLFDLNSSADDVIERRTLAHVDENEIFSSSLEDDFSDKFLMIKDVLNSTDDTFDYNRVTDTNIDISMRQHGDVDDLLSQAKLNQTIQIDDVFSTETDSLFAETSAQATREPLGGHEDQMLHLHMASTDLELPATFEAELV